MSDQGNTQEPATGRDVGAALGGLGLICLVASFVWMYLRHAGIGQTDAYVGAEGMMMTSIIFIGLGAWQFFSDDGSRTSPDRG